MYDQRKVFYSEIEKFTNSKVICYVTGDRQNMEIQIGNDVLEHFVEHLHKIGVTEKISLVLYSRGGNTLTGWSLVNLIKQFSKDFKVIIPSKAHSTATLIALGATSIMMTKQATLGPIDPSVNGPLNPQAPGPNPMARIPVSVESINGYFELVKNVGVKNDQDMAKIIIDLASKIHPVVLGGVYRTRSQIRMLGTRLLSNNIKDSDKISKIIDFLCSESGSHDYTIYRREARDEIGLNIAKPNDEEYKIIKSLHDDYSKELQLTTPFDPKVILAQSNETNYSLVRGIIESINGGSTRFMSKGQLRKTQVQVGNTIQQGIEDQRYFEGWTNE